MAHRSEDQIRAYVHLECVDSASRLKVPRTPIYVELTELFAFIDKPRPWGPDKAYELIPPQPEARASADRNFSIAPGIIWADTFPYPRMKPLRTFLVT
jgi:hypothetical protein